MPGFSYRMHEGEDIPGDYEETIVGSPLDGTYVKMLSVFAFLIVAMIIGRVAQLQVVQSERYTNMAEGNRIKIERTIAPRGLIYDRYLTPVVVNTPRFDLKIVTANLPGNREELERIANELSSLIPEDDESARKRIKEVIIDGKYEKPIVTIKENISHETMLGIKLNPNLPGILLDQGIKRSYIGGESLSQVLGYLGAIKEEEWDALKQEGYYFGDQIGRMGLEKKYEKTLRGRDEQTYVEIDVHGNEKRVVSKNPLTPGNNLILSIDASLQNKLAQVLEEKAADVGGRGAAVALNPMNGEVLALVSVPTYDNNVFITRDNDAIRSLLKDDRQPLFNRTLSGTYPPGSTFKPVVATGALAEGIVSPSTRFFSGGGITLSSWYFPDWKAGGHGWTDLAKSIAESVNTYYYYIGGGFEDFQGLGVARINDYAKRFGFGQTTGIDLPGERSGFLPTKQWKKETKGESWYVGDTYHLAIGQGDILVTPIQLANMMSVFANGGTLYKPQIVKSVTNSMGESVYEYFPEKINEKVASRKNINAVRRGLRDTVLYGSARSLLTLPVTSAGKTGTAQVGGDKEPHAWFAGFAPYENPEIVLVVLVENGISGGMSATPVFREVMNWYFTRSE